MWRNEEESRTAQEHIALEDISYPTIRMIQGVFEHSEVVFEED